MNHRVALRWMMLLIAQLTTRALADDIALLIRPSLCVMEQNDVFCHTRLQATWHHPPPHRSAWCLYQANATDAVFCDRADLIDIDHRWPSELHADTRYYLKAVDTDVVLAETQVNVAHLITDLRPRRRYGWSIF